MCTCVDNRCFEMLSMSFAVLLALLCVLSISNRMFFGDHVSRRCVDVGSFDFFLAGCVFRIALRVVDRMQDRCGSIMFVVSVGFIDSHAIIF